MIPDIRKKYNDNFTEEKYQFFLEDVNKAYNHQVKFRIAETPIFVPKQLKEKILEACNEVIDVICRPDFKKMTEGAVPDALRVPNEDDRSLCIALDFGICSDANGEITPQLIEMQGFPSLYGFEEIISSKYKEHFFVPENFSSHLSGLSSYEYTQLLKRAFVGKHAVENVILLEIEPEKQGTNIDFVIMEAELGIKTVCITKIIREGRKLFYMNNDTKTPIYRIYNRVIFDELLRHTDKTFQFNLTEDVDVEWAGHPNWFFRISKYTVPFIKSKYVPETHFLNEYTEFPKDLENYVLKPLYSFAGNGIVFNVTQEDIEKIHDKENYQLQRKVKYEPVIQSPDGGVKCEIRMLYIWEDGKDRPTLAMNLVRLSKGDLIGVKFNKDKTWVGGSIAFFENE